MGSGSSVVASGGVKTVVAAGVAGVGATKTAAGLVGSVATLGQSESARQLVWDGWDEMKAGTAEIARDGMTAVTTTALTVGAAAVAASARAVEEGSPQGVLAALGGVFIDAPLAAASEAVRGNGAGGAIVAGTLAAHGRGGWLMQAKERQMEDAHDHQRQTLQKVSELGICECPLAGLLLWELAELAAGVYHDPPKAPERFRCDLPSVRDPEEEVEAMMSTYLRRGGASSGSRDLVVLVFRGTADAHDCSRDIHSVVGHAYPGPIIETAAEIIKMYQGQGCDVMVTGHSLGGYLAEVLATTLGLNGVAFCAPGPGHHNGPKRPCGFHTINHDADHIGNHNHSCHQAPPVYITDGGPLMLPSTAHSMKRMVDYMHKRANWSNLNLLEECASERSRIPFHVFEGLRTYRP